MMLDDITTIEKAARRVGMHHRRLRKLAIDTGIALAWGGTKQHPRLRVRMSDVEKVILRNRYITPATAKRRIMRLVANPDVTC
jgi:hypothetical protein